MQNPFRRLDFFLERQEVLSEIERVLEDQPFKNISVVGYSGTGKKKLLEFALGKWSKQDSFKNTVFVQLDVSGIDNERDLIFRLVRQTYNAFQESIGADPQVKQLYDEVFKLRNSNGVDAWNELVLSAELFFNVFRTNGQKLVCILLSFDSVARFIQDGKYYNALAGFSNSNRVKFITISKRSIVEIEVLLPGTTAGFNKTLTFPIVNGHFNHNHFSDLIEVFNNSGIELPAEAIEKLKYYSGNNPQLLIENAAYLFDYYSRQDADFRLVSAKLEQNAIEFNKSMLNELDNLGEKEVYFSLCTGNRSSVAPENEKIKKFLTHGIIQSGPDGSFQAYSEYLQSYIEANTHPVPSAAVLTPPLIYISASETDKLFTDQLEMLLGGLIRSGSITMQTNLEPGQTVEKHLPEVLKKAELVFVVVSPEYSNAKHKELETIIEWQKLNKLDLVPVLYKYYDISNYGLDLDTFQTFPPKALNRWLSVIQDMDKELSEFVEFVKKRLLKKPADNHPRGIKDV